jgi:hypothetical protein
MRQVSCVDVGVKGGYDVLRVEGRDTGWPQRGAADLVGEAVIGITLSDLHTCATKLTRVMSHSSTFAHIISWRPLVVCMCSCRQHLPQLHAGLCQDAPSGRVQRALPAG